MTPLSLDELRELAAGFVMGTLTADELAQFNVGMQDKAFADALAPELAAHRAAIEFLSTERAVAPPPDLKNRLMARIAAEPGGAAAAVNERVLAAVTTPEVDDGRSRGPVRDPGRRATSIVGPSDEARWP